MSTKLYINGNLADLGDAVISETKQINDFFEIQDRQTSFTNKFVLPDTPTNKEIYGQLGTVGIESDAPYRIGEAYTIRNGQATIKKGRLRVTKYIKGRGYDTTIQYGIVGFFEDVSKKKVSELNFESINHPFNTQTYRNSFENNYNDGFIYPVADYGVINTDEIVINYQAPSLFRRWIWDKIWSEAGYSYEYLGSDNPFEGEKFINELITVTEGLNTETQLTPPILTNEFISSQVSSIQGVRGLAIRETYDVFNMLNPSPLGFAFRPKENGYFSFMMEGSVTSSQPFSITILKNGLNFFDVLKDSTGTVALDFQKGFYLSVNDELTFKVNNPSGTEYRYDFDTTVYSDNNTAQVNFESFYDSLNQKTFIKSVLQDYGLLCRRKQDSNVYQFISINELLTGFDNANNWSDKFDAQQGEEYKMGKYGQTNYLKYKYNAEEKYSDGSFAIENETIAEEVTMFTSPYRAAKLSNINPGGLFLYSAPLYSVELNGDNTVKDVKSTNGAPYIFRLLRVENINFTYRAIGQPLKAYSGLVPYADFQGLNYNEIIGANYGALISNLQRPIKRNVTMALTPLDMVNLDFFKLIYLDQFMSYFYINKVKRFKVGKKTAVELIRVIGEVFGASGEYSGDYNNDYNI